MAWVDHWSRLTKVFPEIRKTQKPEVYTRKKIFTYKLLASRAKKKGNLIVINTTHLTAQHGGYAVRLLR